MKKKQSNKTHVTADLFGETVFKIRPVTQAEQALANTGGVHPGGGVKKAVQGPGIGVQGIKKMLNFKP